MHELSIELFEAWGCHATVIPETQECVGSIPVKCLTEEAIDWGCLSQYSTSVSVIAVEGQPQALTFTVIPETQGCVVIDSWETFDARKRLIEVVYPSILQVFP